jgi:hypothetical protein
MRHHPTNPGIHDFKFMISTRPIFQVVGAGGNASNQSAVDVIRGIATGAIRPFGSGHTEPSTTGSGSSNGGGSGGKGMSPFAVLRRELHIGALLAAALFIIAFVRVSIAVQVPTHFAHTNTFSHARFPSDSAHFVRLFVRFMPDANCRARSSRLLAWRWRLHSPSLSLCSSQLSPAPCSRSHCSAPVSIPHTPGPRAKLSWRCLASFACARCAVQS